MRHIKKIKLDVDKDVVNNIQAVQGDSGSRFIHASIQSNGQPINLKGTTVTVKGIKPSNKPIFNNCKIIDEENGVIEITLTNQMLAETGAVACQCKIVDGEGDLLSTKLFNITVVPSIEAEEIESTEEFNALNEALGKVQNIDNKFEKVHEHLDTKANEKDLEIERKRIDSFTSLPEGSTTGDAELIDGRVGADGVVYPNLGNSIRQQTSKSNRNILYLKNGIETLDSYAKFDNGTLVNGQFKKDNIKRVASNDIITFDREVEFNVASGYQLTLCQFQDGVYIKDLAYVKDTYTLAKGTSVKAMIKLVDEENAIDNPNILEFLSKVTFSTKIDLKINESNYKTLLNKNLIKNTSNGIATFAHYCNMVLGTVDNGVVTYRKNRITSDDILYFNYDINLKIADGYKFGMSVMNSDGSYKEWSGWQIGSYKINANTYFKPLIAKVTEDDNKVDLIEMNNTVTFDSYIKQNSISSENNYKDCIELLPGGFGYPGTGTIYTGGYPTNRFITRGIQQAPYDLVIGFKEPRSNIFYQIAFYQSEDNEIATNSDILFKEYRYEKCIIPKGTYFRVVYAMTGGITTSEQYNDVYKNLFIEKHEKNNIAPVFNTLIPSSPKIAMHKGFYTKAPENSKSAYLLAGKEPSVFAIEGDVQVTSDGKFVMYHAEDLSKLTNGSGAVITRTYDEVTSFTYDKVVNGLDNYPNEKICSLEEYLKICKKYGKVALCELKFKDVNVNNTVHFDNFVKTLYKTGMQHSTIVISFTASELAKIQRIDPNIYVLLVLMSYDNFDYRLCGLSDNFGLDVNYESSSAGGGLTELQIEDVHSKGLTVGVWTVDDASIKNNYIDFGVDLITTNTL